ncbi:OPT superfamily oligopeptide transporter [Tilletiaria anomala UBC 951]|uniref:OPT superfamily oligopeptide transporter n=1 Tax=Tilletiaria anomala (strain ATCC 24038 / CBS 436.72 / UBC 951) TaxID=1037660 RepID=A0A066W1L1_TILAU|nr:OPT superfamily oligopeptide transporter [Tilletiaria anomala UBC 951]KDN44954.1 OPT superfamily oligopeptide transporter [Tilletiaria anomala UBC 951]
MENQEDRLEGPAVWQDPALHRFHSQSHFSHQPHPTSSLPSLDATGDGVVDEHQEEEDDYISGIGAFDLQGDAPNNDFTLRSALVGLAIGALICLTNTYFGLQSGWITMASLQAALIGFGVFRLLELPIEFFRRTSNRFFAGNDRSHWQWRRFTPQENCVVQATAVAVGGMPLSAGLVGILPALAKLDPKKDGAEPIDLGWWRLLGWTASCAYFGIMFASPLRLPMIIKEKLRFPSGTATAQLISVLHRKPLAIGEGIGGGSASVSTPAVNGPPRSARRAHRSLQQSHSFPAEPSADTTAQMPSEGTEVVNGTSGWIALSISFALSATFTIVSFFVPVLYAIPVFDLFSPHHNLASKWGWWFTPSFSYIGQGVIMGLPTTVSMTAGAFVGWGVLSPLATHLGWAKGNPLDGDEGAKGWIVWVSLAIMCSESIIGLITLGAAHGFADFQAWFSDHSKHDGYAQLPTSSRDADSADGHGGEGASLPTLHDEYEPPSRLVPASWTAWGLAISTPGAIVLIHLAFGSQGIAWWATFLAIVLSSFLAVLAVRSLGETDLNPTSGLGKISQLIFALIQPGNVVANLIAGGIAEAGAMQAGDLMQDLKTGHLVGASPRSQFYGQILGSTFGIFVSVFAYKLYTTAYVIPGPEFPAPTAAMWLNLARLVNHGHLPDHVGTFMIVAAALFAATGIVRTLARAKKMTEMNNAQQQPRWVAFADYLPSGIAFAVGILNTPNFSIARLIGGLIAAYHVRRGQQSTTTSARKPSALDTALPGFMIIVVASGFVLGEGGASIANLLMKQGGAQPLTCWGCRGGCSGSCA